MKYDRIKSMGYAGAYWNRICHDGYICTKNGPKKRPAGALIEDQVDLGSPEDCTHFLSCCLGKTKGTISISGFAVTLEGGGLKIPDDKPGTFYGTAWAPTLVGVLLSKEIGGKIVGSPFLDTSDSATRSLMLTNLIGGDVIAYASVPDKKSPKPYQHFGFMCSPTDIACHTSERLAADFTKVFWPRVTLIKLPR
ncbi:hypothetical protein [Methylobacterium crusticola]|uniref:hypothetical protein n=1 Tax=Methylobacterium crusticola TaxID=1697972 RepID=UPI000FFC7593|nr:hypothetical protein [Methylobacterium crusticola]